MRLSASRQRKLYPRNADRKRCPDLLLHLPSAVYGAAACRAASAKRDSQRRISVAAIAVIAVREFAIAVDAVDHNYSVTAHP